jgi:hypothetical protein
MLQVRRDLVLKRFSKKRLSAAPRARGIAALDHKVGDDAVPERLVVVALLGEPVKVLEKARESHERSTSNAPT